MTAIVLLGDLSTGHGCFPPTPLVATQVQTVKIAGRSPAVVGDSYAAHTCSGDTHQQNQRILIGGSSTFFIEGKRVCRTGDPISCGDFAGPGLATLDC